MSSVNYNRIPWAGLVLAIPMRDGTLKYATYQMQGPKGTVTIRYEHERDDFWTMVTNPRVVDRVLEVNLWGHLREWDGHQRPNLPLALPPTPGYTGEVNTRPAIDR